ncbi:GGDEF domain-containing protein [Comamonas flocculans]|uniref:diguanylate cyclase n=1 Tax=Comamonas flocculans TaxID=2597701 RepID=A0A5B8RQ90_9BURK|nr:GGDEF domain-containing protein [Comamonas flocculans]QEA11780.1 GGDEF domain-containing protein [Comamonas flocculans]
MVATLIVAMLCVHLLCFALMFWLISRRLQGGRMGVDALALGNALLGLAYVLQLAAGPAGWSAASVASHTLTLCVPLVYWVGGMRFFGHPGPLLRPLLAWALVATAAQVLVQWGLGSVARYAMLSFTMALIFLAMAVAAVRLLGGPARDLRVEMALVALLAGMLGVLNVVKGVRVLDGGLAALDMGQRFQVAFYIYMSFLATVLAPLMIWLVLRRLTDALRASAERDPLTGLLNRRGLLAALHGHWKARDAAPLRLLLLDIDHFKHINDSHGHKVGDTVLCRVAEVLARSLRTGDLASRIGGEEFVVVCPGGDRAGVRAAAERLRSAIERVQIALEHGHGPLGCTVTIGISPLLHGPQAFDAALQQADAALYRGKAGGRNRVEWGDAAPGVRVPAPELAAAG